MQEDSFKEELRRKTAFIPTNFFLNNEDSEYVKKWCPIDNNYVYDFSECTGSYVNGGFQFYPPFATEGCQCLALKDREDKDEEDFARWFVTDEEKTITIPG